MPCDFVLKDGAGEILGWSNTLGGIRKRLSKCKGGGLFTLEIGDARFRMRKTPMLDVIKKVCKTWAWMKSDLLRIERSAGSVLGWFPDKQFPGSLDLLCFWEAWWRHDGFDVKRHLDQMTLEIRRAEPPTA